MNELRTIEQEGPGPLKVLALFSGGASGARYLLEEPAGKTGNFEIVAGIGDANDCSGIEVFERRNLPVDVVCGDRTCEDRDEEKGSGKSYFERLTNAVDSYEPDILLLSGFMRIVKDPLLSKYEGRIINVHPADLRLEEAGTRKYRGTDTVYRTIASGDEETRSTVHIVTAGVDQGPILVVSEPVPINRNLVHTLMKFNKETVRRYADVVQEWMKWSCDGPAIQKCLSLISNGKVGIRAGKVYLEGEKGFTKGYYDLKKDKIVSG
ncbi:MAG: phosphoribosylglycinamide formyltransferase [Candidatus Bipolaricaulia bacterium]